MKKLILPFLSLSLFISACSKDDDKAPKEIIQIQEVEMDDSKLSFTYNEQSQPTKIQFSIKVNDEAYLSMYYLDFTYNNGKPSTADFFIRPQINEDYRRQSSAKFVHNGGNSGLYWLLWATMKMAHLRTIGEILSFTLSTQPNN